MVWLSSWQAGQKAILLVNGAGFAWSFYFRDDRYGDAIGAAAFGVAAVSLNLCNREVVHVQIQPGKDVEKQSSLLVYWRVVGQIDYVFNLERWLGFRKCQAA